MLEYSFLVLSIFMALPGVIVWVARADLRPTIARMAAFSIPFALTERLFYPEYWKPKFLFDLVDHIGFGVEDILFVVGLAAFSSTAWAFVRGVTLVPLDEVAGSPWRRAGGLLAVTFAAVAVLALASVPMIYGACVIMVVIGAGICVTRSDLWLPGLGGATVTLVVYTAACLALAAVIPGVFELDWNTDKFLDVFVLGVPVEELLYAWTAGFIATVFHPFAFGTRYGAR